MKKTTKTKMGAPVKYSGGVKLRAVKVPLTDEEFERVKQVPMQERSNRLQDNQTAYSGAERLAKAVLARIALMPKPDLYNCQAAIIDIKQVCQSASK